MTESAAFEGWAVLELMGHRRLGGYLSEAVIGGGAVLELMGHRRLGGYLSEAVIGGGTFIRIEVPGEGEGAEPVATQFYSPSSVYCITPTTEQLARAVAARNQPSPVTRYELAAPVASPGPGRGEDQDDFDDEDPF